ncbi:MAG: carboxymuconolactone decarboxylase family protein [Planctomycetota bacterium]|nr:carboxymuconolactone decarboxylase family protein [Planctomycetota bacterium]MEC8338626.1 carboxymuconolactone decarboxylase family protein [Planctomycetota bacterium]
MLLHTAVGDQAMVSERYLKGLVEMRRHLGTPEADQYLAKINEISSEFAKVNVEFPFGELYPRDVLDDKTRELCAVTALTVLGHALPELRVHVKAALNCGASREEIVEVVTQMIAYCGFPAATNALLTVKESFDQIDAETTSG